MRLCHRQSSLVERIDAEAKVKNKAPHVWFVPKRSHHLYLKALRQWLARWLIVRHGELCSRVGDSYCNHDAISHVKLGTQLLKMQLTGSKIVNAVFATLISLADSR